MLGFITVSIIIWGVMWMFFRFMYPKPPKIFFPQEGDITEPRQCHYCGYSLAEYRGIVEPMPDTDTYVDTLGEEEVNEIGTETDSLGDNSNPLDKKLSRAERKQHILDLKQAKQQAFERQQAYKEKTTWFFCNAEHQADFHAGKTYSSEQNKDI